MDSFTIGNKDVCAKTVADNLSKILRIKESRNSYGIWQTKGCLTVECDEMWSFVGLKRKMLSFSKKIEVHIGAIWNFIHYYNAEIAPKLAITTY